MYLIPSSIAEARGPQIANASIHSEISHTARSASLRVHLALTLVHYRETRVITKRSLVRIKISERAESVLGSPPAAPARACLPPRLASASAAPPTHHTDNATNTLTNK